MTRRALDLFVNGTLMRGLPLHENLDGAIFLDQVRTAPSYRLYSIGDDVHPGMFEVADGGVCVAGELYRVPPLVMSRVEELEPPGLYRGRIRLEDGCEVWGILYPAGLASALGRDISEFGGWRAFLAR